MGRTRLIGNAAAMLAACTITMSSPLTHAVARPPTPLSLFVRFTLTPSSGPVGTTVRINGHLSRAQIKEFGRLLEPPFAYFGLITEVHRSCSAAAGPCVVGPARLAGCELDGGATGQTLTFSRTTGRVHGSFVVGGGGSCFQSQPDSRRHPTLPGRYVLTIGCHACEVAYFTVSPQSTAATGAAVAPMLCIAAVLIIVGIVLTGRGRSRPTRWTHQLM